MFDPNKINFSDQRIEEKRAKENKKLLWFWGIVVLSLVIFSIWWLVFADKEKRQGQLIKIDNSEKAKEYPLANKGNVSPISGLACENWNRRPIAVMQPSDVQARPAAGFSEADMVIEMPAYTGSVTRLMGIYLCNTPEDIGSLRSARHDYIHLAKGLDAVFIHWGGSHFALDLLKEKVIDEFDCMTTSFCARWPISGKMRLEDTGHIKGEKAFTAIKELGYRTENKFAGYPHQEEAPLEERPENGRLRVAFAKPYDVSYDYDRTTNSYQRNWGGVEDTDKNNKKRIAPKNIVVMIAESSQITTSQDYLGKGLKDPWAEVEEIKKTGKESISGRYNNVQIGDPWYDEKDSGEAYFYFNGQEIKGTWKKDRSNIASKLLFLDDSGKEIKFVPGQIWVEILEPGQSLKWKTGSDLETE